MSVGQNPLSKIKERRITENQIRYVTVGEYRTLMNAANDTWWKALLSVAYGSGLRRNEILYVTWKDIDFENQLIKVTAKKAAANALEWDPKNRKNRVVPISNESSQLLADLQAIATEGHPYVFLLAKRLKRIIERRRIGKWPTRSEPINNLAKKFIEIRAKAEVEK